MPNLYFFFVWFWYLLKRLFVNLVARYTIYQQDINYNLWEVHKQVGIVHWYFSKKIVPIVIHEEIFFFLYYNQYNMVEILIDNIEKFMHGLWLKYTVNQATILSDPVISKSTRYTLNTNQSHICNLQYHCKSALIQHALTHFWRKDGNIKVDCPACHFELADPTWSIVWTTSAPMNGLPVGWTYVVRSFTP